MEILKCNGAKFGVGKNAAAEAQVRATLCTKESGVEHLVTWGKDHYAVTTNHFQRITSTSNPYANVSIIVRKGYKDYALPNEFMSRFGFYILNFDEERGIRLIIEGLKYVSVDETRDSPRSESVDMLNNPISNKL